MRFKAPRGWSGVNVITVFTSGTQMGKNASESQSKKADVQWIVSIVRLKKTKHGNPSQPRSYLSTEPGNMRATENKHHPVGQAFDRLHQLELMGHLSTSKDAPVNVNSLFLVVHSIFIQRTALFGL